MKQLILSKEIYREERIRITVNAFKDYAIIIVREKQDDWIIQFSQCKLDQDKTVLEFENYLIGIENT